MSRRNYIIGAILALLVVAMNCLHDISEARLESSALVVAAYTLLTAGLWRLIKRYTARGGILVYAIIGTVVISGVVTALYYTGIYSFGYSYLDLKDWLNALYSILAAIYGYNLLKNNRGRNKDLGLFAGSLFACMVLSVPFTLYLPKGYLASLFIWLGLHSIPMIILAGIFIKKLTNHK